jgi:diacylglycerol kinase family enzyme
MKRPFRYSIIANPVSGHLTKNKRYLRLKKVAAIFHAKVYGLDTGCTEELAQCALEQANQCDVLVAAGGDGTLSLVINAIDLSTTVLAFLPFGTGNALTHALQYKGGLLKIAKRIYSGTVHEYDLIDCDGSKKAFMASLGFDGTAIRLYERYRSLGYQGLKAHFWAAIRAFFRDYRSTDCRLILDGDVHTIKRLLSLMVVKQPFFGKGLKAVPQARWDDKKLHSLTITSDFSSVLTALITGFTVGNLAGKYRKGKRLTVSLDNPVALQIDGDSGWTSNRFSFTVLPGVLKLKH